jgi:hypothetical protein
MGQILAFCGLGKEKDSEGSGKLRSPKRTISFMSWIMTANTECIRDVFEIAECGKCKEIKKDIFTILVNQKLILCSECFEDFQWGNVTEWDEDDGSFMGA